MTTSLDILLSPRSRRLATWMVVATACSGASCSRVPSVAQIDDTFERWANEESLDARTEIIFDLIDRICVDNSANEGERQAYAVDKLIDAYRATEDESILIAMDKSPEVRGGFSNTLAGLYRTLLEHEACRERYRNDAEARAILYQRATQAIDKSEIDQLLDKPD